MLVYALIELSFMFIELHTATNANKQFNHEGGGGVLNGIKVKYA